MPYKPVEDYELDFDIDRILRDPPVLRALTYLRVPNEYLAQYSRYSIHAVLSWRAGRRLMPDDAADRLIELAACIIKNYEEQWDKLQALEKDLDKSAKRSTHLCEKLLIHLQAARALVALQRQMAQGEDMPVSAGDFFHEAFQTAAPPEQS